MAVMGDGGFGFMMEELAMACQYKVPIIVVIVNNGYLSLIRQNQNYAYEYEYGVDLTYDGLGMDFVKMAEAFGAYGERVTKPGEIEPRLPGLSHPGCRPSSTSSSSARRTARWAPPWTRCASSPDGSMVVSS